MLEAASSVLLSKCNSMSQTQKKNTNTKKTICSAHTLEHLFCITECESMHVEKSCVLRLIYLYTITQLNGDASNFHITVAANVVFGWASVTDLSFLLPLCHTGWLGVGAGWTVALARSMCVRVVCMCARAHTSGPFVPALPLIHPRRARNVLVERASLSLLSKD